jgi:hypothetical protein
MYCIFRARTDPFSASPVSVSPVSASPSPSSTIYRATSYAALPADSFLSVHHSAPATARPASASIRRGRQDNPRIAVSLWGPGPTRFTQSRLARHSAVHKIASVHLVNSVHSVHLGHTSTPSTPSTPLLSASGPVRLCAPMRRESGP